MEKRTRSLLADNINALIDAGVKSHAQVVGETDISNGTLGRIRNEEVDVGIDKLDELAKAFSRHPWELLVPATSGQDHRHSWPFPGIDPERFARLTYEQKIEIQGIVRERLERFEDRASPIGNRTAA